MKTLYQISETLKTVLNNIELADGEVTPEIETALNIAQAELQEKGMSYAYVIKESEAMEAIVDAEIKRLQERKKQFSKLGDKLKEKIKSAMIEFDVTKIDGELITLSFRKSKEIIIDDENMLPTECIVTKTSVDKARVKALLVSGIAMGGAHIEEKMNLQIK